MTFKTILYNVNDLRNWHRNWANIPEIRNPILHFAFRH